MNVNELEKLKKDISVKTNQLKNLKNKIEKRKNEEYKEKLDSLMKEVKILKDKINEETELTYQFECEQKIKAVSNNVTLYNLKKIYLEKLQHDDTFIIFPYIIKYLKLTEGKDYELKYGLQEVSYLEVDADLKKILNKVNEVYEHKYKTIRYLPIYAFIRKKDLKYLDANVSETINNAGYEFISTSKSDITKFENITILKKYSHDYITDLKYEFKDKEVVRLARNIVPVLKTSNQSLFEFIEKLVQYKVENDIQFINEYQMNEFFNNEIKELEENTNTYKLIFKKKD